MEVDSINGVPFKPSRAEGTLTDRESLAENFDNFLMLLTTQLKNQDPLSPLDTNQFTEQLVQFAGVEQDIKTNDKLDELIGLQNNGQLNAAVSYIGKSVAADSLIVNLDGGTATVTYDLESQAETASVQIVDQNGQTVRVLSGPTEPGHHELVWDGTDSAGNSLPDGLYGLLVTAVDSNDKPVSLVQGTVGRVTGIEMQDGEVILNLGELQIPMSQVTAIREGPPPPTEQAT